jgi:ribosomal protein S18 acetylase RimI-like enzyme
MSITIRSLHVNKAAAVARLHIVAIRSGFISSLGFDFVTALYESIAESEHSFGFVALENDKVLGFVAFTSNLNTFYKSVMLKKGARFALLLAGKIFSLQRIRKIFETLFYPSRIKKMDLPKAELLSIAVSEEARGRGLAAELTRQGFAECAKRGITKVKVLVAASNEPANKLYIKCGFTLFRQIDNHGVISNIYIAQTVDSSRVADVPKSNIQ